MDLTRRQLLAAAAGEVALVGSAKAADNVVLGYDRVTGTNLLRQNLAPLVLEDLQPSDGRVASVDGHSIAHRDGVIAVRDGAGDRLATLDPATDTAEEAASVDRELGLSDGPLEALVADLKALGRGNVRVVADSYPAFFDLVEGAESRPDAVSALRGRRTADPETVAAFAGADPTDPKATAEGLVDGFREHTSYDLPRYAAGSIEDNVLLGAYDLRQHFESPTTFDALAAGENDGLFCYELTRRSVEALQAIPAREQTVPVLAGYVKDDRHKHVYTIVASVVRSDDDLVVPVTFLDYTHSTLYDDLRVRRLTGEGLDAYGDRHRATSVAWYR